MKPKNKYFSGTHISEAKFRSILMYFCEDETATKTARYTGLNRRTVDRIYTLIRERILTLTCAHNKEKVSGEVEVDESYFGARRVRGKRGRGARGKVPVFGILKRGGDVHVTIVKNCSKAQLMPILKGKVLEGSTVYSDGWKSYDGLVYNYGHYRVYHSHDEFARGKNHINGIESFWSYAKRRLNKFNGVHKHKFPLYLKECEFRFNHRNKNMYDILLQNLRESPL